MGIGGGKSEGTSTNKVILTPEQQDLLKVQTDALKGTFLPAYQSTVTGAKDILGQVMPAATAAAGRASDVAARTGALQEATGAGSYLTGVQGLANLFGPEYKQQQVNAALQAGREATREQLAAQNAMYGAAGGLGGSRQALADLNLQQLGEQRQATAAANAAAGVEANRAAAAQQLANIGQSGIAAAQQAAANQIALAQTPQDVFQKYAGVVYGVPQASTVPNFQGTQGSQGTSSSKGMGFQFTK
jgi:hypothetical protein